MANRTVISLSQLQHRFQAAYANLLSGEWQDNDTGEDITRHPQLEAWLRSTGIEFCVDEEGCLHLLDPLEGDQAWKRGNWEYVGPHPSW